MTTQKQALLMDGPLPANLVDEWQRYLRYVSCVSNPPTCVFDNGLLFPLQRRNECKRMIQIAKGVQPKVVMEIGADKGGSVYLWLMHVRPERMIVCEVRGTPYCQLFEKHFPDVDFLWLPQSSYAEETVEYVQNWLGNDQIDVLFIDGDKSYFSLDFNSYSPMVDRDGVIFMHDVQDPGPMRDAWLNAVEKHSGFEFVDTREYAQLIESGKPESEYTAHEGWLRYWKGSSCGVGAIYL